MLYRFYKNAKKTSQILADQLFSPADRIRYWVDYVIRHKGAPHLRSDSSNRLNWFQYWSLDVAAFLLSVIMMSLYVILRVFSLVGRTVYNTAVHTCFKFKIE
jgi:glucuronosyltransferase